MKNDSTTIEEKNTDLVLKPKIIQTNRQLREIVGKFNT
jgi:hypothetical protein